MSTRESAKSTIQQALAELFSGYRAEWLSDSIFDLFTEPAYFPELETATPCFLEGGRGTGKTTALRSLSYEGMAALPSRANIDLRDWPYFGTYYRVNTNRVSGFIGPELTDERWTLWFAHYMNLELSSLVLEFVTWYQARRPEDSRLPDSAIRKIGLSLQLGHVESFDHLVSALETSRIAFENAINNVGALTPLPMLTMQGAPIDVLFRELKALPHFASKTFFFLIDEYENFDNRQQRVVNTLIKHCGELYSFKVGVREFGFREHRTLREHEVLQHPADYKLVPITEELTGTGQFGEFAARVCNVRIAEAVGAAGAETDVRRMFPDLDADAEAELLGVSSIVNATREEVGKQLQGATGLWWAQLRPLEAYAIAQRAASDGQEVADKARDAFRDLSKWSEQFENYKYSYLFGIRRGKSGIRKYYCGWDGFCLLAAGNIRYLLELVDEALTRHVADDKSLHEPISSAVQTKAAQATGNKNLRELEGLALSGARLTRLLLGLGRVFQVMAESPFGHTPEVNQFRLDTVDVTQPESKVEELLVEGVMHLALVRYRGNKLQQDSDIRQWDYAIHPIFAPFFGYSHRRKRRIAIREAELIGLVENSAETIRALLTRQNRVIDEELPEQMALFAGYYGLCN